MALQFVHYIPPYDEDEIVGIILKIYKALSRQGHFKHHSITYAPTPNGHDLDLSELSEDTVLDDRVLSLMRRLPVPQPAASNVHITRNQIAIDYTNPVQLAFSRNVGVRHCLGFDGEFGLMIARPTDMILFDEAEAGDGTLIYDTNENTIRVYGLDVVDDSFMRSDATEDEKKKHDFDYRNHPTHSAPVFLRGLLQDILEAKVISGMDGTFYSVDHWFTSINPQHIANAYEVQRKLLEDYKWPSAEFRADDWQRDAPGMLENVFLPRELEGRPY